MLQLKGFIKFLNGVKIEQSSWINAESSYFPEE